MRFVLLLIVLFLTACATQPHQTKQHIEISESQRQEWATRINEWWRDVNHLDTVAYRILTKGADYCKQQDHLGAYIGARFWTNQSLAPEWKIVAQEKLGLGNHVQIAGIVPSSPADLNGLKLNDVVVAINGTPVQNITIVKTTIDTAVANKPIIFTVQRAGSLTDVSVSPITACKSAVSLADADMIDSSADGQSIVISRGLLHFTKSDEEIATVLSHQLAHNANKHQRNNKIAGVFGGLLGGIVGGAADVALGVVTMGGFVSGTFTSMGWELGSASASGVSDSQLQKADQDGMRLMVMADYNIDNVADFWERVNDLNDPQKKNRLKLTLPITQQRRAAMISAQKQLETEVSSSTLQAQQF
ncbi:MAG TPA: M48 family metallopeptidase [Nitrosomonas sp.]|nr:M48 family metallopeptidase [Nitrosomonas sp.]